MNNHSELERKILVSGGKGKDLTQDSYRYGIVATLRTYARQNPNIEVNGVRYDLGAISSKLVDLFIWTDSTEAEKIGNRNEYLKRFERDLEKCGFPPEWSNLTRDILDFEQSNWRGHEQPEKEFQNWVKRHNTRI